MTTPYYFLYTMTRHLQSSPKRNDWYARLGCDAHTFGRFDDSISGSIKVVDCVYRQRAFDYCFDLLERERKQMGFSCFSITVVTEMGFMNFEMAKLQQEKAMEAMEEVMR